MIASIAIDDEPLALNIITAFCDKIDFVDLKMTFTETAHALEYLKTNAVDLLFLDIKMPAMSGIDFYKMLSEQTMVIFTTAYSEYAVEGFNLNAIDYLLKPFDFARFNQALNKANDYYNHIHNKPATQPKDIFIRADYSLVKITCNEILYIEGLDNYLKIHLSHGKNIVARISMKAMMDKLPFNDFIRVHRSYIIPVAGVQAIRNKVIYLKNGVEVPVGSNYYEEVNKQFRTG